MSKKIVSRILLIVLAGMLVLSLAACATPTVASAAGNPAGTAGRGRGGQGGGQGMGAGGAGQGAAGSGAALTPLSDAEAQALLRAIQEEYTAQALYQSALDALGNVAPFNRIVQSETQHAAILVRMAEKYGVSVPAFTAPANLPDVSSLSAACQAGAAAEIADAALYDELIPLTTHADLLQVYNSLKNASLDSHLPAFEACQ